MTSSSYNESFEESQDPLQEEYHSESEIDPQPFNREISSILEESSSSILPFNRETSSILEESSSSNLPSNPIKSPYNRIEYTLDPPNKTKIYIFKEGLFIRELLPINPAINRQVLIACTRYIYFPIFYFLFSIYL